jgi:hypothetical protein
VGRYRNDTPKVTPTGDGASKQKPQPFKQGKALLNKIRQKLNMKVGLNEFITLEKN